MIPDPASDTFSKLERSFFTTSLVPTAIFLTSYVVVVVAAFWSWAEAGSWWSSRSLSEQALIAIGYANVLWFVASLLASNWRKIVRLFEGYPLRAIVNRLERSPWAANRDLAKFFPGIAYHLWRQRRLVHSEDVSAQYVLYTDYASDKHKNETLPTATGNILLAAERYAEDRYALDVTLLWPRLYRQLPEAVQRDIETFREEHQLPLALSLISFVFAIASAATVAAARGSWLLYLTTTGLGSALSLGAYVLSLERTREYGEQLRTVFDLYHPNLTSGWHGPPFRSDELAEAFIEARSFVLTGPPPATNGAHDSTLQGWTACVKSIGSRVPRVRNLLGRLELDKPTRHSDAPSVDDATGVDTDRSDSDTDTDTSGIRYSIAIVGEAASWLIGRFRFSLVVAIALAAVTVVGTVGLSRRTVSVLVPLAHVEPGEEVNRSQMGVIDVRSSRAPRDVVTDIDPAEPLLALTSLAPGEPIRSSTVRAASEMSALTLPSTSGIDPPGAQAGDVLEAIVAPCGIALEAVILADVTDQAVTILLGDPERSVLEGCSPEELVLLPSR